MNWWESKYLPIFYESEIQMFCEFQNHCEKCEKFPKIFQVLTQFYNDLIWLDNLDWLQIVQVTF